MKNLKKRISAFILMVLLATTFCAPAMTANAEGSTQLYFKNSVGWDKVYCYIWQGSGPVKGTNPWPGAEMTLVEGSEDWYQVEYTSDTAFQVIFNDNGTPNLSQTGNLSADLEADKEAYWFVLDGATTEEGASDGFTAGGLQVTVLTKAPEDFLAGDMADDQSGSGAESKETAKTGINTILIPVIVAVFVVITGIIIITFRKKKN